MITKFSYFIKESLSEPEEKVVRCMTWLYMLLVYENNNGMWEKDWMRDNRMGITFEEAIIYLKKSGFIELYADTPISGKQWKITKKGKEELYVFFNPPKTREEWLNYDGNEWLKKYDTNVYKISGTPNDLYERKYDNDVKEHIQYTLTNLEYYKIRDWWGKYQHNQVGWWTKLNKYLGLKNDLIPDYKEITLYRGLNIKCDIPYQVGYHLCDKIKNKELKIGDKVECNKPSWTIDVNVARSFASGKKGLQDARAMKDYEFGIILKHTFNYKEILIDTDWIINHKFFSGEQIFPQELEVIVQPKKRTVEIMEIFNSDDYYKKFWKKKTEYYKE